MGLMSTLDLRKAPGTWILHGVLALGVGLLFAVIAWVGSWTAPAVGYLVGVCGVVAYFTFVREPLDRLRHKLKGDYDELQPGGATPRADLIGDLLAPWALLVGSIVGLLL